MKQSSDGLKVSILGREYFIACTMNEQDAVGKAATYLDRKMREIQNSGRVVGVERCAIMAALNVTHQLLKLEKEIVEHDSLSTDVEKRLESISRKIESAVEQQHQMMV